MKLGKRNSHFFRIVAIDSQKKNSGEALEVFGYWYPDRDEKKINAEAINAWVSRGAQMSATVAKLIETK